MSNVPNFDQLAARLRPLLYPAAVSPLSELIPNHVAPKRLLRDEMGPSQHTIFDADRIEREPTEEQVSSCRTSTRVNRPPHHWMLDVHLDEDLARASKDNAPADLALINCLARNTLQFANKDKIPISHHVKKCT